MNVKDYEKIIRQRLKDARFEHSKNVSKEAVRLAKKYGADVEKAAIAGILHDITKETSEEEQLEIMKKAGIELSPLEANSTKLWHAISGSGYIKIVLGIDDEDILNAVRYHTTARGGMSLLEKIIFISDFTSAERDYDGVDEIRKAADKSLEAAMIEGLSFSIEDLAHRRLAIAKDTLDAYNEVILKKK